MTIMEWTEIYTAKCVIGEAEMYIHKTESAYMWTIWQGKTRLAVGMAKSLKAAMHQVMLKYAGLFP